MRQLPRGFSSNSWRTFFLAIVVLSAARYAVTQDLEFHLDPQHTSVNFTLGDVLHTVHGSFQLKQGSVVLDSKASQLSGEIVVDAKSGASGNGMRDRKMNREVLESERYPEIVFGPKHLDGTVQLQGKSSLSIKGVFAIHGSEHEMTVPAEIEMFPDHWTGKFHFSVPYVNWGMKNPSTLFLRVSEAVEIEVVTAGTVSRR